MLYLFVRKICLLPILYYTIHILFLSLCACVCVWVNSIPIRNVSGGWMLLDIVFCSGWRKRINKRRIGIAFEWAKEEGEDRQAASSQHKIDDDMIRNPSFVLSIYELHVLASRYAVCICRTNYKVWCYKRYEMRYRSSSVLPFRFLYRSSFNVFGMLFAVIQTSTRMRKRFSPDIHSYVSRSSC